MKLTVFNCSPKKNMNNTEILLNKFIEGFLKNPDNSAEIHKLNRFKNVAEAIDIFKKSECVMIAFPLYIYSMPAGVKEFIENIETVQKEISGKKIIFLVQSGFPEAIHARPLEKYLETVSKEFGFLYLGTIIKGGCSTLAENPGSIMAAKKLNGIYKIGKNMGENLTLNLKMLQKYSSPEKMGFIYKMIMLIFLKMANKFYWKAKAVQNGAAERINDQPYMD